MTEFTEMPAPNADWIGAAIRAALTDDPGWHVSYRLARTSAHKAADAAGSQDHEWKIWHDDFDRLGAGPGLTYYEAFLDGRGNLVFSYGNSDAGIANPANTPLHALLLPLRYLETLLARVLRDRETYPPNRYGLS